MTPRVLLLILTGFTLTLWIDTLQLNKRVLKLEHDLNHEASR